MKLQQRLLVLEEQVVAHRREQQPQAVIHTDSGLRLHREEDSLNVAEVPPGYTVD